MRRCQGYSGNGLVIYIKGLENLDLDVELIEEKVLQIREDISSDECYAFLNSSCMAKLSQLF